MKSVNDEEIVEKFLRNSCPGISVCRFTKKEKIDRKTPDFKILEADKLAFYCEVKSIDKDNWLDNQLEKAKPGEIVGGIRQDPIFNRLTDDIYKAEKQFKSVNKKREYPNVLVLVNHDIYCKFNDLLSVITGNFYAKGDVVLPIDKKYSEGRIKNAEYIIDLFIWLDDNKPEQFLLSQRHEVHKVNLCRIFEKDPKEIKLIPY